MAKVLNDVVKMDWEKSGWLQTKPTKVNPKGCFMLASKDYENENGDTIWVFFNSDTAFLWGTDLGTDDEDLWTASDLKNWLKEEYSSAFPNTYEEYLPIIESGTLDVDESVLERYGITAHKDDIVARMKDVLPYSEETTLEM